MIVVEQGRHCLRHVVVCAGTKICWVLNETVLLVRESDGYGIGCRRLLAVCLGFAARDHCRSETWLLGEITCSW